MTIIYHPSRDTLENEKDIIHYQVGTTAVNWDCTRQSKLVELSCSRIPKMILIQQWLNPLFYYLKFVWLYLLNFWHVVGRLWKMAFYNRALLSSHCSLYSSPYLFVKYFSIWAKTSHWSHTGPVLSHFLVIFCVITLFRMSQTRGPQPPGHRPVSVRGLLRTKLHSRRWAAGKRVKLHLPLPIVRITAWTIPPTARPICGKIIFHENRPWCQKGWGPLSQTILCFLKLYLFIQ